MNAAEKMPIKKNTRNKAHVKQKLYLTQSRKVTIDQSGTEEHISLYILRKDVFKSGVQGRRLKYLAFLFRI